MLESFQCRESVLEIAPQSCSVLSVFKFILLTFLDVDTIVQFALMEFKLGDPQRGQTVLEEVLSNYPKRSDIWSVYIDMMIKHGDNDAVR